jgi:hypothetical protein
MEEGAPFKDLINIPANRASDTTSIAHYNRKTNAGKREWYARLSDEKKA